jgi:hypothetical protein
MTARALLVVLCLFAGVAHANKVVVPPDTNELLRALDTDDPTRLDAAVIAIEDAPTVPGLADVLFSAGRAAEDRLHDPARALALYDRILRELPDAGVAIAAGRRAEILRAAREHAREAAQLAQLYAIADALPRVEVERRAKLLIDAAWPGAPEAAMLLADWRCRNADFAGAQQQYAHVIAVYPDAEQASLARRNAAGCAIDAKDWDLAERLATQLAGHGDLDEAVRVDLMSSIATGRRRDWLYSSSWIALAIAGGLLLVSFVEAIVRGGVKRPAWQPPVEVMYIGPVALVLVAATYAIDSLIAPAVIQISAAGIATAWVSGATLDLCRQRERSVRMRALGHVVACAFIVLAVGYIAMTRADLLDMLGETVRFGPGA